MDDFSNYGYIGVFAALLAAGFGFPIPEELPVITAGILVGHVETELHWYFMLPVVIAGVVIGDGVLYGVGRIWGHRLLGLGWVQRKLLPPEQRLKIEKNIADRGIMVLLGARMLPGIRTPIFIMAGILRVPLGRFLLADGIYAIPLVNVLFWSAYMLTDQVMVLYGQIKEVEHKYRPLVIVMVLSGVISVLVYKYLFSRHVSTGEAPHMPQIITKPAGSLGHVIESAVDKVTGRHFAEKHDEHKNADLNGVPEEKKIDPKPPTESNGAPEEKKIDPKPPTESNGAPEEKKIDPKPPTESK